MSTLIEVLDPLGPVVLTTDRLTLAPLQMEHVYTHFRWTNDEALHRLESHDPFVPERLSTFMRRYRRLVYHPPATMANFEVFFEGRLVGVAHLDQVDRAAGSARCAVTLGDRAVWGQHLGAEVVQALATYASEELGLRCLVADAQPHNYRWCRLLTRLGFTFQPEPVAGVLQFALELDASVELKTRSGWAVTAAVA